MMENIQTVSGKPFKPVVSFMCPLQDYQRAMEMAREQGVKLSVIMRALVRRGLEVELGDDGQCTDKQT